MQHHAWTLHIACGAGISRGRRAAVDATCLPTGVLLMKNLYSVIDLVVIPLYVADLRFPCAHEDLLRVGGNIEWEGDM
jgi:hypothetical protein